MMTPSTAPDVGRIVADALAPQREGLVDAMMGTVRTKAPELVHNAETAALFRASSEANVVRLLEVVRGEVSSGLEPPAAALEYAHHISTDSDVSLAVLLRSYRRGQAAFTTRCLELAGQTPGSSPADLIWIVSSISSYVDQACERITNNYQDERERWLQSREGMRQQWIGRILEAESDSPGGAEAPVDLDAAEEFLRYRLRGQHVAMELWANRQTTRAEQEGVRDRLYELFDVRPGRLLMRTDQNSVWLWLHPGPAARLPTEADLPPGAFAAVGSIGSDVAGFRRSRREASRVRALMTSARHQPRVATWDQIAPIATMASDPRAVSALIETTLGELAEAQHDELRETLAVFLETNRSHLATGERLHLHRNTVSYRVRKALDLCAADPDAEPFALMAALNADRWLPERASRSGMPAR